MRGDDNRTGKLFSYVDLEARVRRDHPLRAIRTIVNEALEALEREFAELYSPIGRPSIPPEKLLRAMLLQAFYSIRSERLLMERLEYDLLFRWFVGIGIDDATWDHFAAPTCVNRRTVCVKPSPFVHAYNAMAEFTALAVPAVDAAQGYANKPRR